MYNVHMYQGRETQLDTVPKSRRNTTNYTITAIFRCTAGSIGGASDIGILDCELCAVGRAILLPFDAIVRLVLVACQPGHCAW